MFVRTSDLALAEYCNLAPSSSAPGHRKPCADEYLGATGQVVAAAQHHCRYRCFFSVFCNGSVHYIFGLRHLAVQAQTQALHKQWQRE